MAESFSYWVEQLVSVNSQVSGWSPVSSGIPQGSVLGPVMFVIYINDLPSSVKHALVRIFADNTKMYKGIPSYAVHAEVQSDLANLKIGVIVGKLVLTKENAM